MRVAGNKLTYADEQSRQSEAGERTRQDLCARVG